jgi:hypothetical protein
MARILPFPVVKPILSSPANRHADVIHKVCKPAVPSFPEAWRPFVVLPSAELTNSYTKFRDS